MIPTREAALLAYLLTRIALGIAARRVRAAAWGAA